jgi:Conserved region in glutamate synthase
MYRPYHLETSSAPNLDPVPSRFRVKVKKSRLASLLLKELIHYRGNRRVVLSRPCVYGVFSGPLGGFAPREQLCVGCLRCTTEHPEIAQIYRNPEHQRLGDSYFTAEYIDTLHYEARTGRVPVKGAGYRGRFGGECWDGMWTDMSEIVRPTRDGIHGREVISTVVDLGFKPPLLTFNEKGKPTSVTPQVLSLPIPFLFDVLPASLMSEALVNILMAAANRSETLLALPLPVIVSLGLTWERITPLVTSRDADGLAKLRYQPLMVELAGWNEELYHRIQRRFPHSIISLRLELGCGEDLVQYARWGAHVFHLVANYHGRGRDGRFVLDLIREAHRAFVDIGVRDEVTLVGSGGIISAEHIAKAIICGLDAIALDTPLLAALQARFEGECIDRETSQFTLPRALTINWGVQRIENLQASWRDQLLEVLGAMGLREVRRLRGEIGRGMFQQELEREAFAGIDGYVS